MTSAINTVVLGASGYVGAELLRLIAAHPQFELSAAVSNSRAGNPISELLPTLAPCYPSAAFASLDQALVASEEGDSLALFAAAPHGVCGAAIARVFAAAEQKRIDIRSVDVSADFRYADAAAFESVYGTAHPAPHLLPVFDCAVPEHQLSSRTPHVAHPGCFATAILLAAVPAFHSKRVHPDIYVSGVTGSTGSGRSAAAGTHHPERHSNLYAYKALEHRHVPEVEALIKKASGQIAQVSFVPHSGPFARGIYVTLQARLKQSTTAEEVLDTYQHYYADSPFVQVGNSTPRLKDVVASNYARLSVTSHRNTLAVTCAIDNLVKGAAGGAVQWMNRLWSLREESGLTAPAPGWT